MDAIVELGYAERQPFHAGCEIDTHGRDQESETAADEIFRRLRAADRGQHRETENGEREILGRAERVGDAREPGCGE